MQPSTIVPLEQVGVTYPNGVTALESVSLSINRGEFAVLLGCRGRVSQPYCGLLMVSILRRGGQLR